MLARRKSPSILRLIGGLALLFVTGLAVLLVFEPPTTINEEDSVQIGSSFVRKGSELSLMDRLRIPPLAEAMRVHLHSNLGSPIACRRHSSSQPHEHA